MIRLAKWLSLLAVTIGASTSARAAPETGWWWNAAESGRGYFVESHDGAIFLGGYFYADDGRATWLVSGGANADPYNYTGRLLSLGNGQRLFGDYQAPSPPVDAGAVTVHFDDDQHGTLTWPGGAIPIVRQVFGTGIPDFQPLAGWWWNPGESGRGYSLEVQGNNLFVVAFMYDDAGNPVWYFSAGPMATTTHYDGQWVQFSGGQTLGGPYHPPAPPAFVSYVSVDFGALDDATLTVSDTPSPGAAVDAKAGHSRIIPIQRQFRSPPPYTPPPRFDGNFTFNTSNDAVVTGGTLHTTAQISGALKLVKGDLEGDNLPPVAGGPWTSYIGAVSQDIPALTLTATYSTEDTTGSCTGNTTVSITAAPSSTQVWVSSYGHYDGKIGFPDVPYTLHITCTYSYGPPFSFDLPGSAPVDLPLKGGVVYGLHGKWNNSIGNFRVNGTWNFAVANP